MWEGSLKIDLKPTFDMAITEGMNRLAWYKLTSSPSPPTARECFAGAHLGSKATLNAGDAHFL